MQRFGNQPLIPPALERLSVFKRLIQLLERAKADKFFKIEDSFVVTTERSDRTSPQAVVNMFKRWYHDIGLLGCSSHSGRRTFITNAARKIGTVGGSLRDVQMLAGHSSLSVTQRYIERDVVAQKKTSECDLTTFWKMAEIGFQ